MTRLKHKVTEQIVDVNKEEFLSDIPDAAADWVDLDAPADDPQTTQEPAAPVDPNAEPT